MKKPSFLSFLKEYLKYLGDTKTLALPALVNNAATSHPRVIEPLYFYAALTNQVNRLLRLSRDFRFYNDYYKLADTFKDMNNLTAALEAEDSRIPTRFLKIYKSYQSQRDRVANDKEFAVLAQKVLLEQLSQKNITKYRVYKDLSLNPSNINSYLKHGDTRNISRKTVNSMLKYVREAKPA
jgi:hypothetical protein